eukprot:7275908-Pyramimonas_sp.AAC.1
MDRWGLCSSVSHSVRALLLCTDMLGTLMMAVCSALRLAEPSARRRPRIARWNVTRPRAWAHVC